MTGGCGRLLSTEAVSLSSLSLSLAPLMPPLPSSSLALSRALSLVSLSLCENCSELTVCSGVWLGCAAFQDALARGARVHLPASTPASAARRQLQRRSSHGQRLFTAAERPDTCQKVL